MIKKNNSLEKINVVGDRVLVKPRKESEKTDSGLYLPPGVREKEKVQYGYIIDLHWKDIKLNQTPINL